jgi:hypothetical protein
MKLVPSVRPYAYGFGYVISATTAFPNLFWDVHPATAFGAAADWLVREVAPVIADAGGGLGYSVIAESYLNFSWAGVLVMFLLGLALGRFTSWVERENNVARVAVEAVLISFLTALGRGETSSFVRPILWLCVAPYLYVAIVRRSTALTRAQPASN